MNKAPGSSPLVNWTGYLAIALLLTLPLAVFTVRSGAVQQGLLLFALSCLGATAVLILCVVLLMLPRFSDRRPDIVKRALLTLPGALLLAMLVHGGGQYPPIHDITTDTVDPPQFRAAPAQRGPGSNSLEVNPDTIAAQQRAYPELSTVVSDLPIDTVYDRALLVAREMGWEVYHEDRNLGVIEAVDTTAIMAFKDDIVIRVRSNASGSLLDLRSVSRVGVGDLGANQQRIADFQRRFAALGEFQP